MPIQSHRKLRGAAVRFLPLCLGLQLLPLGVADASAQLIQSLSPSSDLTYPLMRIGGTDEERLRIAQAFGQAPTEGFLLRTPSRMSPAIPAGEGLRWGLISPEATGTWNSSLPFSLNDGSLWAGRGISSSVTTGIRASYRGISVTLSPQIVYSENRDFKTWPWGQRPDSSHLSAFASPWHREGESADLPLRFGNQSFARVDLGQSVISMRSGPVEFGASSENQWWGPGSRNAIVMSNNAAGVPRLFARTATPLQSRLGTFDAEWMIGGLTESLYFDTTAVGRARSISGFVGTFSPRVEQDLTVGVARTVISSVGGWERVFEHAGDVFTESGRQPATPDDEVDGADQLMSLFARWLFPASGLDIYSEWARRELPRSFRDLLVAPNHSQGYTLGLKWTRPVRETSAIRFEGELTYLEQSPTYRVRKVPSYYVSQTVTQGFTERGQVLGAAIGPGASSQWTAVDYFAESWRLGAFFGRIRWENDAYYTSEPFYTWQTKRTQLAHDTSVFGGGRASANVGPFGIEAEFTTGMRYNYLFQNRESSFIPNDAVDIWFHSLRFNVSGRSSR